MSEDGWIPVKLNSPELAADYAVFDALEVGGLVVATIECFATHRTFYANAVDRDKRSHRTVWMEFDPAKTWCENTTGFARRQ